MPRHPESALKPCPFCGGNPETTPYFHIEAAMCGNKACPIFHIPINFETWNSRPTASAPADEAVRKAVEEIAASLNSAPMPETEEGRQIHKSAIALLKKILTTLKRLGGQQ